ncbi:hypothetical protein AAIR98_001371 [Elusimicrobium simillimum]|uniref:hypothetical protein n=1 Tax=Elusimicrobium simillimum TaxID=3143438 RepID=UPI003C6F289F
MKYWIFQGNPDADWLKGKKLIDDIKEDDYYIWSINQHKKEIQKYDVVLFLISGPQGGIVSEFVILDVFEEKGQLFADMVRTLDFEPIIKREQIKEIIPNNALIKARVGTNFAITQEEYFKIMEINKERAMTPELLESIINGDPEKKEAA